MSAEKRDTNVCQACSREQADKRCGRCKLAVYCGADCQRNHWPTHKPNCSPAAAGAGRPASRESFLLRAKSLAEAGKTERTLGPKGFGLKAVKTISEGEVFAYIFTKPADGGPGALKARTMGEFCYMLQGGVGTFDGVPENVNGNYANDPMSAEVLRHLLDGDPETFFVKYYGALPPPMLMLKQVGREVVAFVAARQILAGELVEWSYGVPYWLEIAASGDLDPANEGGARAGIPRVPFRAAWEATRLLRHGCPKKTWRELLKHFPPEVAKELEIVPKVAYYLLLEGVRAVPGLPGINVAEPYNDGSPLPTGVDAILGLTHIARKLWPLLEGCLPEDVAEARSLYKEAVQELVGAELGERLVDSIFVDDDFDRFIKDLAASCFARDAPRGGSADPPRPH